MRDARRGFEVAWKRLAIAAIGSGGDGRESGSASRGATSPTTAAGSREDIAIGAIANALNGPRVAGCVV